MTTALRTCALLCALLTAWALLRDDHGPLPIVAALWGAACLVASGRRG